MRFFRPEPRQRSRCQDCWVSESLPFMVGQVVSGQWKNLKSRNEIKTAHLLPSAPQPCQVPHLLELLVIISSVGGKGTRRGYAGSNGSLLVVLSFSLIQFVTRTQWYLWVLFLPFRTHGWSYQIRAKHTVTLGNKLLNLSQPQFPHLSNG
jgi:hypothetical protein